MDTEAAQRREAYEKQAEKEKEQLLQDAQRQANESGGAAGEQRLPQQDAGDVALAHTQHVV